MKNFLSAFRTNGVAFPFTKAKDRTAPGVYDGTQFIADLIDDLWGFYQAILKAANITPSGNVETANASGAHELTSQAFQALKFSLGTNRTLNCWWDGTNWKYSAAGAPAIRIELNGARIYFYYAAAGTINTAITWTTFYSLGFEDKGLEILSNLREVGASYYRQGSGSGFVLKHNNTGHTVAFRTAPDGTDLVNPVTLTEHVTINIGSAAVVVSRLLFDLGAGAYGFGGSSLSSISDWNNMFDRVQAFYSPAGAANQPANFNMLGLTHLLNNTNGVQLAFRMGADYAAFRRQNSGVMSSWVEFALKSVTGGLTLSDALVLSGANKYIGGYISIEDSWNAEAGTGADFTSPVLPAGTYEVIVTGRVITGHPIYVRETNVSGTIVGHIVTATNAYQFMSTVCKFVSDGATVTQFYIDCAADALRYYASWRRVS